MRRLPPALIALVVSVSVVHAQDVSSWVGQRVVTKVATPLMIGRKVVDDDGRFRIYTVEQVNGDRLWLVSGSVNGWVQSSTVVLFDQAIDYCTQQVRSDPKSAYYYLKRGLIWAKRGKTDIALTDYNKAIEFDPRFAEAFNNRGNAWSAKKEYDKALADYNEAIELDPEFAGAFNNRGRVWLIKTEYDKALADYNEAVRIDPKFANAFNNRGRVWRAKSEYGKALADFNEAIRLDPKYAGAFNNRAWLWATCPEEKVRDGKRAVESATRACELNEWKDAGDLDTLAAAYAEAGEFDRAVEWQEKANALYTNDEDKTKGVDRLALYKEKTPYREKAEE